MRVKELRALLKGLPANMEVVVNTGIETEEAQAHSYGGAVAKLKKAKTKLVKGINGYEHVQSRPKKDDNATLKLVLE